jgi:hypothetical protein
MGFRFAIELLEELRDGIDGQWGGVDSGGQ